MPSPERDEKTGADEIIWHGQTAWFSVKAGVDILDAGLAVQEKEVRGSWDSADAFGLIDGSVELITQESSDFNGLAP